MPQVFAGIGKSDASSVADRFIAFVKRRGVIPYGEGIRWFYSYYPDGKDLEGMLAGVLRSGHITVAAEEGNLFLKPVYNPDTIPPANHAETTLPQ